MPIGRFPPRFADSIGTPNVAAMNRTKTPEKADRLRAALRENLKRRKAQAKGRSQAAADKSASTAAHDSAEIGADKQNR